VSGFFQRGPDYLIPLLAVVVWKSISLGRCPQARNEAAPLARNSAEGAASKISLGGSAQDSLLKATSAEGAIHFSRASLRIR
jgi:hypothetical protein